ncbi:FixH family protein [Flavobacteriaceae bacterium F89]|uniref:FixH family protein n=1 Tax=Cerina litoralis TaxID=2874477 RepID=A0AAE3ESP0_9FLAO|nr:FixH family protein [Cerina litoralis]MCG2460238.1 FixH family protein [Cerina litoralis]
MKINWGTGIVLTFVAFITFILYFVIRMNTDRRAEVNLVTEDYYQAELGIQDEIDAEQRANNLLEKVKVQKTLKGLNIVFPKGIDNRPIEGTVTFYRPSNKRIDFELPLILSDSRMFIPDKRLVAGRWDITVFWTLNGKNYIQKKRITY